MDFTDATGSAADIAQVVALVVGGTWAYVKFIRGRTFRRRGELGVAAELLSADGGRSILARVSFRNTGLSRIKFNAPSSKGIFVYELREDRWHPELEKNIDWGERDKGDMNIMRSLALRDHAWVEPGELIDDEILLPVGRGGEAPLAYQVVARVATPGRRALFWYAEGPRWTARTVLPVRLEGVAEPYEREGGLGARPNATRETRVQSSPEASDGR